MQGAGAQEGGEFFTPPSLVQLIVNFIQPDHGIIHDPACGSGGMFVQTGYFVQGHTNKEVNEAITCYGTEQKTNNTRLAKINLAIHGIEGKIIEANSFYSDPHSLLGKCDFVMANPPFNMKEWDTGVDDNDPRWVYGKPPSGNANFAWLQHMLYHLAPNGSLGLLLANGSMSSNTSGEGDIRKALIENDLVECMVALPGQLFTNTQIPACIWFLTKNKNARTKVGRNELRQRTQEVLFIDARNLGYMKDRVLRDFTQDDLNKISDVYHAWQTGKGYEDQKGFCASANLAAIQKHDYVLTPGRYVGAEDVADDGEAFADKMARLTGQLKAQFEESDRLEAEIKKNLAGLGYEC